MNRPTFKTLKQLTAQIPQRLGPVEGTIYMSREELQYYFNKKLGSDIPRGKKTFNGYEIVPWPQEETTS